jgi:hypothetical protein
MLDLDTYPNGMLPHVNAPCVIRYMVHQGYEEEEAPLLMGEEEKIKGEEGKKEEGRKEEKQDRPPQPVIPALTAEAWPETRNMSRSDRPCQPV